MPSLGSRNNEEAEDDRQYMIQTSYQTFNNDSDNESADSNNYKSSKIEKRLSSTFSTGTISFTPFRRSPVQFFNEKFKAGGVKGSVATLVVSIVGAGTLSVPYAIQQSGLILGPILFFLGAILTTFTLQLLTISSELTAAKSYERIARKLYGKWLSYLTVFTLVVNLYGTTVSYLVASGRTISLVLQTLFHVKDSQTHNTDLFIDTYQRDSSSEMNHIPWYFEPQAVTIMLMIFVILPLSLLRTMTALRYSSLLGVSCTCYLTVVVVVKYFQYCTERVSVQVTDSGYHSLKTVTCVWEGEKDILKNISDPTSLSVSYANFENPVQILTTIPIVIYAYTCHPSLLPILLELNRPNQRRMKKVIGRSNGISFLIYFFLGTFVYLTFVDQLNHSNGNFLLNDYHKDPSVLLGAIGISISMTLAVPLLVSTFRNICSPYLMRALDYNSYVRYVSHANKRVDFNSLSQRLRESGGEEEDDEESALQGNKKKHKHKVSTKWHYGIAIALLFSAGLPAVLVKDISKVFTLLGATSNPLLCFVFPAMFIWRAGKDEPDLYFTRIFALVIAVIMPAVSLISLGIQMYKW